METYFSLTIPLKDLKALTRKFLFIVSLRLPAKVVLYLTKGNISWDRVSKQLILILGTNIKILPCIRTVKNNLAIVYYKKFLGAHSLSTYGKFSEKVTFTL